MSDPVPAITEANATGEIAEIFADIRRVLRVDVVNLIWRHLATIPGALPRAWGSLRPLYADGTIGAEAAALHRDLNFPRLPPFPREVLAGAGLLDDDIRIIRNILSAYDRTNAMALVALSALLLRLEDKPRRLTRSSRGASAAREPLPLIPLPPLLNLGDMPPATAELVLTLNRLGTRRDNPILASMYRHLAHWPTYLSLTWAFIAPLDGDGSLARSIDDAIAKAQTRAARHVMQVHAQSATSIAPSDRAAIRSATELFAGDVIAKMVVICGTLRAASLPDANHLQKSLQPVAGIFQIDLRL
jgi:hypothetical protein